MTEPLLLHICCAPDEAWVVHTLRQDWNLHCFFCNPNIQPEHEYLTRLDEARKVADHYAVPFDADAYDPASWESAVQGLESTGEGGARCRECFLLRLRRTAAFGAARGFAAFTTVMSVSPHKQIAMLHQTGSTASGEHGMRYMPFDFKKQDGFRKSVLLSRELGIYRQDYCGCRLSRSESDARKELRCQDAVHPVSAEASETTEVQRNERSLGQSTILCNSVSGNRVLSADVSTE